MPDPYAQYLWEAMKQHEHDDCSSVQPKWVGIAMELKCPPAPLLTIEVLDEGEGVPGICPGFKPSAVATRGQVPHLDVLTTAECPSPFYLAFEYDTFRGLERVLFSREHPLMSRELVIHFITIPKRTNGHDSPYNRNALQTQASPHVHAT